MFCKGFNQSNYLRSNWSLRFLFFLIFITYLSAIRFNNQYDFLLWGQVTLLSEVKFMSMVKSYSCLYCAFTPPAGHGCTSSTVQTTHNKNCNLTTLFKRSNMYICDWCFFIYRIENRIRTLTNTRQAFSRGVYQLEGPRKNTVTPLLFLFVVIWLKTNWFRSMSDTRILWENKQKQQAIIQSPTMSLLSFDLNMMWFCFDIAFGYCVLYYNTVQHTLFKTNLQLG